MWSSLFRHHFRRHNSRRDHDGRLRVRPIIEVRKKKFPPLQPLSGLVVVVCHLPIELFWLWGTLCLLEGMPWAFKFWAILRGKSELLIFSQAKNSLYIHLLSQQDIFFSV